MSRSIIAESRENTNLFDTDMISTVNDGGSTIIARAVSSTQLDDAVHVYVSGRPLEGFYLNLCELTEHIENLQILRMHLMESEPREIRRNTEPGNPSFEEAVL